MITRIVFDVHGATANVIAARAREMLIDFDPEFDERRWTVAIDVSEEGVAASGQVSLWRGEVEARRHDSPV